MHHRVTEHRWAFAGLRLVLGACAPIFVLLSNLYLLFTPAFVQFEYAKPGFPPSLIYEPRERLELAQATLHYLRSDKDAAFLAGLRSRNGEVYNPREISHMVDVKMVLNTALGVHAGAGVLCATVLFLLWRPDTARRSAWQSVFVGCVVFIGTLLSIGLVAYVRFDLFFTAFHRAFFEGDSWLFAYSDTLIQLFPLPLWIDATWYLSLLSIAECSALAAFCWLRLRPAAAQPSESTG